MENVETTVKDNVLTIRIRLDVEPTKAKGTPEKPGKMMLYAKTGGWQDVPGTSNGLRFNVMVGK